MKNEPKSPKMWASVGKIVGKKLMFLTSENAKKQCVSLLRNSIK